MPATTVRDARFSPRSNIAGSQIAKDFVKHKSTAGNDGAFTLSTYTGPGSEVVFQFGIPIQKIPPTFVKIVWREAASDGLEFVHARLFGDPAQPESGFPDRSATLEKVTVRTGSHNIGPVRSPAPRPRNDVIECQVTGRQTIPAILAGKLVAQENVEPGKGRAAFERYIFLERYDTRQFHFERRGMDFAIIFRENINAFQKHCLKRILPGPQGQREIA